MKITDEVRSAVIAELVDATEEIVDGSKGTVKLWLLARRAMVDESTQTDLLNYYAETIEQAEAEHAQHQVAHAKHRISESLGEFFDLG